jgi:tetratricopeptide (TPR) repeat protein/transcriptional regulator with XRE-family HTH domain
VDEGRESSDPPLRPEARLGAALRSAREKRAISLRALARRLYRSHSNLVEYERGHRLAPLDVVQAYERELAVVQGTLVVVHEKARLELCGEDLSRRPRVDREALRDRSAMEVALGRLIESGVQDLRVLLPEPVASFTGRAEELRWLAQAGTGPVVVTQALAGLGGVGKTALALEYAHRCFYTEHSVDLAWWFVAADRLSLSAAMARVYEQLVGVSVEQLTGVPVGEDSVLAAGRLRNWLESSPYRWLVVFDNADVPGVLDGLLPHAGAGQVLITSRRADWSLLGASVRRLDVLSEDESVALLGKITGRDDEDGARILTEELDGLAVALRQAGAAVRKTGWDYQRYLQMLRTRPLGIHSEDLAGAGTTIAKVWESSLEQATRRGPYGTLASDVLGVLAYFAAEDIPRFLFEPPAIDGETALGGGDPLAVDLALVGLAEYSLINLEDEAIGLHRLVQHFTRVHLEGLHHAKARITAAIHVLWHSLAEPGLTTQRVGRLLSHITEATDHAARLSASPEESVSVLNTAAQDRLEIGQLDIARPLVDRALRLATASLGPDHPHTLATRNNLGRLLGEGGRVREAVAQLQELLDDRVRVLGPDHPHTLWTRHNLAYYLEASGRVRQAVAQFQALLDDRLRVLGPDHPATLWSRHSLARSLGDSGKFDEAVDQFQPLLEDALRVLGPDHSYTLTIRGNLARFLGEGGRAEEAVAQLQAVLEDRRRVLGPDHRLTLTTRHNLGRFIGEGGRIQEAMVQLRAVLEDRRRVLGPDHPDILWTRHNLAVLLGEAGRKEDAIAQLQAVLEDRLRLLGPDHPHTLITRNSLASLSGEAGRVDQAIAQFRALLKDCLRVLGPDHPETLKIRNNLALWLRLAGEVDGSLTELQVLP